MENVIGENVRRFREHLAWTQEHLAEACGVSTRTIQRIEAGGPALAETQMALASVFGVDVHVLREPPPSDEEIAAALERVELVELAPIERGSDIGRLIDGGSALYFDCVRLEDDRHEDAVAEFRQALRDWLDLWAELEPVARRDAEKSLQERLGEMLAMGLVVGGAQRPMVVKFKSVDEPMPLHMVYVVVSLKDQPKRFIVRDKTQPVSFT